MARNPTSDFDLAWQWILSLSPRGIQLGLERMKAVLARLNALPSSRTKIVTVAGTNGKGSTCAFLDAMLRANGYRVGLYMSPHLVSVTERIKVDGYPIGDADFAHWAFQVREVMQHAPEIQLTVFEVLTAMAMGYFLERQCDVIILEVGLGGRLDATNAIDADVAVLTPVGLDHQEILGLTEELICKEKVAILKPGATLVSGVSQSLWRSVVGPYALALRAPVRRSGVDFVHTFYANGFRYRGAQWRLGGVTLGLKGKHQGGNAALALAAAEALANKGLSLKATSLALGLERARHRGRLERHAPSPGRPAFLVDGAHNPMGAKVLAQHVVELLPERPRILCFGLNPEKDSTAMLKSLVPLVDAVVLSASSFKPVEDLDKRAQRLKLERNLHVLARADARDALALAEQLAGPGGGVVLTGSLYFIGDLFHELPHPQGLPKGPLKS